MCLNLKKMPPSCNLWCGAGVPYTLIAIDWSIAKGVQIDCMTSICYPKLDLSVHWTERFP